MQKTSNIFGNLEESKSKKGVKKVRLTKIIDSKFNGNHPNNIDVGYTTVGYLPQEITVEHPVVLTYASIGFMPIFRTSRVTKILNKNLFETENSSYKVEYL